MNDQSIAQLPVEQALPELIQALAENHEAVLQAPPGAGKTTLVPLALLRQPWLQGQKILMLEPRRIAARTAAARMAELLGEQLGQTVGYRIRLESRLSQSTRIEVITEGILTRRLQADPALEGVGLVIFDEFHERNLDTDLALALTLQGREVFREGSALKLLVMSATLDGEGVAALLGDAPVVTSQGRQYPVDIHYGKAFELGQSILPRVQATIEHALNLHAGNILVFLPGQAEIRRLHKMLNTSGADFAASGVLLAPLYGALPFAAQQRAIAAPPKGVRKIVLATNIAETSLTIEGVNIVIDSGLQRRAVFDPNTGVNRLTTERVSRANADQRAGRAGRLRAGHCYRLWSEEQQQRLVAYPSPEILQADLTPLALQLLAWGVQHPQELAWMDVPAPGAYAQGLAMLEKMGAAAVNENGQRQLTPHGVRMSSLPLHPRLAHMLMLGADIGAADVACLLAALLLEHNPLAQQGADLASALTVLQSSKSSCPNTLLSWYQRCRQQAKQFAKQLRQVYMPQQLSHEVAAADVVAVLLASAYPDRIARLVDNANTQRYLMSNGRQASLPKSDALQGQPWLVVADLGGQSGEAYDRIYSATALNPASFDQVLAVLVQEQDVIQWNERSDQFIAQRERRVGKLVLEVGELEEFTDQARIDALIALVAKRGLSMLPWTPKTRQWQTRVNLLYQLDAASAAPTGDWPDLSDEKLLATLSDWLAPFLGSVFKLRDFEQLDLLAILQTQLPWAQSLELEQQAPQRIAVPSGEQVAIDYTQSPPVLAVKLQQMFGCVDTPTIANGRQTLSLQLLSPARRPLQITQDLAAFWRGAYSEVRKEMKGRYPKHPWPQDPLTAIATAKTKGRMADKK